MRRVLDSSASEIGSGRVPATAIRQVGYPPLPGNRDRHCVSQSSQSDGQTSRTGATGTPQPPPCEPNLTNRHPHRPNRHARYNPTRHRVSQSSQSDGQTSQITTTGTSQPPPCEPILTQRASRTACRPAAPHTALRTWIAEPAGVNDGKVAIAVRRAGVALPRSCGERRRVRLVGRVNVQ